MTRLPIQYWREGSLHWARFVSDGISPVRVHWAGISDSEAIDSINAQHWHRFAITNNNREEVAVYLRFVWSLIAKYEVLGNAHFSTEDAARALSQAGSVVSWQFETDGEGPPGHLVFKGFTPARSAVRIHPPPTERQRWMRDKTLLFRIGTFADLVALLQSVLNDAAGEITLFATTEKRAHRIVELLRADEPPHLEDILAEDDLFISAWIGVDLGFNDHLAVASRSSLEPLLAPLGRELDDAISAYEAAINPFVSPQQALGLMARLAGQ